MFVQRDALEVLYLLFDDIVYFFHISGLCSATCPRVKTNMETWDWSPLSGVQVQFHNTTATDGNNEWTVHLCGNVYSNMHDYGRCRVS